ncbi:MAG: DUF1732 domain-containing protein [Candidatus Omnitrophica bacterium]|nr:DUF1732 domain-containing protein [Candidatus Omnitrophota bacterium]
MSQILALPQVICLEQKTNFEQSLVQSVLKDALDKLVKFKEKEGKVIKKEVVLNLKRLGSNVEKIKKYKPRVSKNENGKEDIDEELSLTSFYVKKLREKINNTREISKGKPVDFLTQEILRELNAASSKTHHKKAALLIVEAKTYLDRIREQAQNIE